MMIYIQHTSSVSVNVLWLLSPLFSLGWNRPISKCIYLNLVILTLHADGILTRAASGARTSPARDEFRLHGPRVLALPPRLIEAYRSQSLLWTCALLTPMIFVSPIVQWPVIVWAADSDPPATCHVSTVRGDMAGDSVVCRTVEIMEGGQ